jgi:hypothetical protein
MGNKTIIMNPYRVSDSQPLADYTQFTSSECEELARNRTLDEFTRHLTNLWMASQMHDKVLQKDIRWVYICYEYINECIKAKDSQMPEDYPKYFFEMGPQYIRHIIAGELELFFMIRDAHKH